jgi:hypothetical protein
MGRVVDLAGEIGRGNFAGLHSVEEAPWSTYGALRVAISTSYQAVIGAYLQDSLISTSARSDASSRRSISRHVLDEGPRMAANPDRALK